MDIEVKGAIMATDTRVKSEQEKGEKTLIEALGEERAQKLIANRVKRDGNKAHITLASPQDSKKAVDFVAREKVVSKGEAQKIIATLPLNGNWKARGLGSASSGSKVAYFVVVDWPGGRDFRDSLGLSPEGQDFHITVGFGDDGDVHGVPKNRVLSVGELAKTASLSVYTPHGGMRDQALRSKVIRLAHQNPELRPHLIPLLKTAKSELYALLEGYYDSRKRSEKAFSQAVGEAKTKYDKAIYEAHGDRRAARDHAERVLESTLKEKFNHIPAVREYFHGPDAWDREGLFDKVKQQKL